MGKVGYIVGNVFGIIVVLIGLLVFAAAFMTKQALSSWFAAFLAMFILIIGAVILFAASRAKPKSNQNQIQR